MLALALTTLLVATPEPRTPQLSVAVMELSSTAIDAERRTFLTEHLALKLAEAGVLVTSPRQMTALLGAERQRQLLGCSDDSCMLELAEALGSDVLLLGELAVVGSTLHVNLKATSGQGRVVATWSGSGNNDGELKLALEDAAEQLARESAAGLGRTLKPLPKATKGVRRFAWAPLAVGLVAAGVGGALFAVARSTYQKIPQSPAGGHISEVDARALVASGNLQQTLGVALICVSAAAVATAVAMFVFGAPQQVQVTASVGVEPGKASLLLGGTF